jgi:hypothetical protein
VVQRRSKAPKRKRPRSAVRAVAQQADQILEEARNRELEYSRLGIKTVTISREELIRSLRGKTAHSPFIAWISYSNAVRGGNFVINFAIMQPDPWPYEEGNLGLCYCWSDAGGLADPGIALLRADPAVGVVQVPIGTLNTATMPYDLSSTHLVPNSFNLGPADLNYFLYAPDAFGPATLLKRGTIRVLVS